MPGLLLFWRSLRLALQLALAVAICVYIAAAQSIGRRPPWVPRVVRWWYAATCRALGVQLEVTGVPQAPALLVVNHVSWLDILVIGAQGEIGFLSKDDIRHWPLIGWLAGIVGTHFITRGAAELGELTASIAARIRGGQSVAVFPEGTTSDGTGVLRFHPRLFAIGQRPGIPVQPVALRYGRGLAPDPIVPFIGADTFPGHLARLLAYPDLYARVHFLAPLDPGLRERRQLAEQARAAIARAAKLDPGAGPELQARAAPEGARRALGIAASSSVAQRAR